VKNYTVIVRPDDGIGAETVVKLQIDGAGTRITQLQLTAGNDGGLSVSQLPAINLEMLLAAVLPAAATMPTQARIEPPATAAQPTRAVATQDTGPLQPGQIATEPPAAAEPPQQRKPTDRAAQTKKGLGSAGKAATRKPATGKAATPKPAKAVKAGRATRTPAAEDKAAGRTYRTLPEDFADVYRQGGSVAAVADYYNVPAHTVTGWMRTARKRGLIPEAPARAGR
jgi:hypothetical protein